MKLYLLEVGRGVASLMVGLVHAGSQMKETQFSGKEGMGGLFHYGFLGVDFFFVLSGFIICYAYFSSSTSKVSAPSFVVQRIFRIFPAYLAALALFLVINRFQRSTQPLSAGFLFEQVTLSAFGVPWLGVAWTLQFELLFYGAFAMVVWRNSLMVPLFTAWILILIASAWGGYTPNSIYSADIFGRIRSGQILEFIVGLYVASVVVKGKSTQNVALLLAGGTVVGATAMAFLSIEINQNLDLIRNVFTSSLFGLILLGLIRFESHIKKPSEAWMLLGALSYSFYLVHSPILSYCYAIAERLNIYKKIPEVVLAGVGICAGYIVAYFLYRFVEKPGIKFGKALSKRFTQRIGESTTRYS
jgi:exopolysaccharide production protein ExoZ